LLDAVGRDRAVGVALPVAALASGLNELAWLRLGEIELSIVALHTSASPVDFPPIAGWRLDRGLNNYKLLRDDFSMTFHIVSSG